jgi:hypothetical protein
MALQKQTVSLNIAASINQKADDKQIDVSQLAASKNVRIKKDKRVQKREGLQDYSTAQSSLTATSPITIGASDSQSTVSEYGDKIVMENKGVFYQRDTVASNWKQLAYAPNLSAQVESVANATYTTPFQSVVEALGYRVIVSTDDTVGRLTIIRLTDNLVITKDQVIFTRVSSLAGGARFGYIQVVAMDSNFALAYIDGTTLYAQTITPATAALGSLITINSSTVLTFHMRWVGSSARGGRLVFVSYINGGTTRLQATDNALTIDATLGNQQIDNATTWRNVYIYQNDTINTSRLFIYGGDRLLRLATWDIGALAWTVVTAAATVQTLTLRVSNSNTYTYLLLGVTAIVDPQDATKVNAWYSVRDTSSTGEDRTHVVTHDHSGAITTASAVWSYGLCVTAEPYNDPVRVTTLLPVAYYNGFSSFLGVADFHRSRTSRRAYLAARFGEGLVLNTTMATTTYSAPVDNSWTSSLGFDFGFNSISRYVDIDNLIAQTGTSIARIKLENVSASHFVENETLFLSGAQSFMYDGAEFGEFGFSVRPMEPQVTLGAPIAISIVQQGTGALPEITDVIFGNGNTFPAGNYWTFSTTTTNYYVWYTVNGVGVDPAPGGTGILCAITSTDTWQDVSRITARAITLSGAAVSIGEISASRAIRVTNSVIGAVTDATAGNFQDGPTNLAILTGTYQFCIVYLYVDKFGKIYRSQVSDINQVTTTATRYTFSAVYQVPDITNREYRLNSVELYVTEANGSIFYLASTASSQSFVNWSGAASRLQITNVGAPTASSVFPGPVTSAVQLYTTGGVFENDYPTGWRSSTSFKTRRVILFENSNRAIYSKSFTDDTGLAFSEFLDIVADQDEGDLTAIGAIDDKLILLKEEQKFAVVGDPANDAGGGGSLSLPQAVSSDTGCNDFRSLVQSTDGLYYRSAKGIYRLGRDLQDKYIGDRVEDTNGQTVSAALLLKSTNEIVYLFSDSQDALCYNYYFDVWTYWQNHQCSGAFAGTKLYIIRSNGRVLYSTPTVFKDVENGTTTAVPYTIEMPWLKVKGQQDYQRIKELMLLGQLKSAHSMTAEIWWDYDMRDAVKQTLTIASSSVVSGTDYADGTYQIRFAPQKQKCEAIKVRFTDTPDTSTSGESCTLNAVDFNVGLKAGLSKLKTGKQV